MSPMIKYAIILLLAEVSVVFHKVSGNKLSSVALSFQAYQVVPDVIPKAPDAQAIVIYPSGAVANAGNILPLALLQEQPALSWYGYAHQFYTITMVDPDVPSRIEPIEGEFRHWLVVNVPGVIIAAGDVLSTYLPPTPPPGTGPHRYVILVYKQPGKLDFHQLRLTNRLNENRTMFSIANFARKYHLGNPIAGNFYQAQFNDKI